MLPRLKGTDKRVVSLTITMRFSPKYPLKRSPNWVMVTLFNDQEYLWTDDVLLDQGLPHKQILNTYFAMLWMKVCSELYFLNDIGIGLAVLWFMLGLGFIVLG